MKRKKRKFIAESRCLNCDTVLTDTFCAHCGQKSGLEQDHFWHLVWHFIADYFHFDGKFLNTTKAMFLNPGKVTRDYLDGKRKTYLHPIQMYIFVSAIFFLLLGSIIHRSDDVEHLTFEQKIHEYNQIQAFRDSFFAHNSYHKEYGMHKNEGGYVINGKVFTKADYDSCEASITELRRDTWFEKRLNLSMLKMNEEFLRNGHVGDDGIKDKFISFLPKSFFFLLPVFAMFLWMFFNHKPFIEHIIFSLHYHVVGFLVLAVFFLFERFFSTTISSYFLFFIFCVNLLYLLLAMKQVFKESWLLTVFKFIGFVILYCFFAMFFSIGLLLLSYLLA